MRRLIEDPQLPSEVREALAQSRNAGVSYDHLAKLSQLRAALSDPTRQPLDAAASHGIGAATTRRMWQATPTAWKLALIVSLGGLGALALQPARRELSPPTLHPQPSAAMTAPPAPPPPQATPAPSPPPTPAPEQASPTPLAPPSPAPPPNSSRREIAQLAQIRALLDRDPVGAYKLACRSEQEFPRGMLREERQALLIVALAKSGAIDDAQHKAQDFIARYPRSPMRRMIDAALHR